jgi:ectoine hydroxylase-related dioxygenase (phytanoyl-CoA dioxygenase family)
MRTVSGSRTFYDPDEPDIAELEALTATLTTAGAYQHAERTLHEVVIYDAVALAGVFDDPGRRRLLQAELAEVLSAGPGVFVIRRAVERALLDQVTMAFQRIIDEQRASGTTAGDHFAAPGANDRVWNVAEKLALAEPDLFVDYHACDALAVAAVAWLGPRYQVTAQLNVVNPGGAAQEPHRDYHLGFMTPHQAADYPAHVHALSAMLTLQGSIAHCDMLVESGPTIVLPHSHKYGPGYVTSVHPEVKDLFARRAVQLPLDAGDSLFFNPALLHAAGANRTADRHRMANLFQISSPFGRAMEQLDRTAMSLALYPALRRRAEAGWPASRLDRVMAAAAEGYAFPTDLDRDPPIGGKAPESQAELLSRSVAEAITPEELAHRLAEHGQRRRG